MGTLFTKASRDAGALKAPAVPSSTQSRTRLNPALSGTAEDCTAVYVAISVRGAIAAHRQRDQIVPSIEALRALSGTIIQSPIRLHCLSVGFDGAISRICGPASASVGAEQSAVCQGRPPASAPGMDSILVSRDSVLGCKPTTLPAVTADSARRCAAASQAAADGIAALDTSGAKQAPPLEASYSGRHEASGSLERCCASCSATGAATKGKSACDARPLIATIGDVSSVDSCIAEGIPVFIYATCIPGHTAHLAASLPLPRQQRAACRCRTGTYDPKLYPDLQVYVHRDPLYSSAEGLPCVLRGFITPAARSMPPSDFVSRVYALLSRGCEFDDPVDSQHGDDDGSSGSSECSGSRSSADFNEDELIDTEHRDDDCTGADLTGLALPGGRMYATGIRLPGSNPKAQEPEPAAAAATDGSADGRSSAFSSPRPGPIGRLLPILDAVASQLKAADLGAATVGKDC